MKATARLALLAIAGGMILAGCSSPSDSGGGPKNVETEPSELESMEVREYEGKDLSSVTDFRENSIKGPQYVELSDYVLKISGMVDTPMTLTYDEVLSEERERFKKVEAIFP